MTATLAFGPPATAPGRATFTALAIRETRRLVLNPVFLFAVAFITFALWAGPDAGQTEIDTSNPYPAIFLGGFGMMATYWLTRSMRASERRISTSMRRSWPRSTSREPMTMPSRRTASAASGWTNPRHSAGTRAKSSAGHHRSAAPAATGPSTMNKIPTAT